MAASDAVWAIDLGNNSLKALHLSLDLADSRERIQGYEKDKMKTVEDDKKSAMPVFGPDRLSPGNLDDLLRYLQGLRGFDPTVRQ